VEAITLRVPAGQTVAILGPTGSGKTTVAHLVARLFDPQKGRVLVDGADARELPLRSLRHAVGFVPQDTFLFGRSIRDNIAFGALGSEDWEIAEAAEIAQIAEEVDSFPDRYETVLGERGTNLSGGQRQRVSIARALLANPRILILDDAASSVDAETEEQILRNLETVMRNRTTLLITHRVSAACLAERIVVLDRGKIVEEGLHEDLLNARGRYYELSQKQQLEEELELA
jgi:ATP-binding cassette subfamily B protein